MKAQKVPTDPVEEEYGIWKKNAPFLYDIMFSRNLVWPSLTVDWLPKTMSNSQEMLIGTQTSGAEQNYLRLAEVEENSKISHRKSSEVERDARLNFVIGVNLGVNLMRNRVLGSRTQEN